KQTSRCRGTQCTRHLHRGPTCENGRFCAGARPDRGLSAVAFDSARERFLFRFTVPPFAIRPAFAQDMGGHNRLIETASDVTFWSAASAGEAAMKAVGFSLSALMLGLGLLLVPPPALGAGLQFYPSPQVRTDVPNMGIQTQVYQVTASDP